MSDYVQEPAKKGAPMLYIDDVYRIETDPHNFILITTLVGHDKAGNEKLVEQRSYHPTLVAALRYILTYESRMIITENNVSLPELVTMLEDTVQNIVTAVMPEGETA